MVLIKKLKSEEGSTLAYLMVIMAILIMLGVAIMMTTFAGYMLKVSDAHDQTAMYVSEAGLNEAYAYIGEEIENATQYSRNVYIPAQLLNHPEVSTKSSDEASYKAAVNGYFKKGYKAYFVMNEGVIKERLEKRLLIKPSASYGANGEAIASIQANLLNNFSETVETLQIQFTVTVVKTNHLKKAVPGTSSIKAILQVGVPAYETPIAKQAKVIKKNALLDHAIAADGNLYVSGGKVTIEGNATILGQDGKNGIQLPSEAGGVIVGGLPVLWDIDRNPIGTLSDRDEKSGSLEVTGDLVTGKFLRIGKSSATEPSTILLRGNFHGNSIAIQGASNEKASIDIEGSASVFDDMELESPNSTINVDGSYYGFSSGNAGSSGVNVHDNSSSIVINNSNFGLSDEESRVTVRGQKGFAFPASATTGPPAKGTYLAGTIYADEGKTFALKAGEGPGNGFVTVLSNGTYQYNKLAGTTGAVTDNFSVEVFSEGTLVETKVVTVSLDEGETKRFGYVQNSYQTGDSVSVHGNYIAYSEILDSTKLVNMGTDPVDDIYLDLDELTYFEAFEPLFLVNKKKNPADPTQPLTMNYMDKEKYSFFSQRQSQAGLNLGNGKIDLGTIVYSTGTVLNPSGMSHSVGDLSTQSMVLAYLAKEYNYRVECFGDPQHQDYITEEDNLISGGVRAWLRGGSPNILSGLNNELFYMQPESNKKSVILKGVGDDALLGLLKTKLGSDQYKVMEFSDPVKGMIVSNKDIYVLGNVNYEGLLVAKENVYCMGEGLKTFKNTNTSIPENYITGLAIDGINAEASVAPKKIGYWFRQENSWREVIVDNRYIAETGGVYGGSTTAFDHLVKITQWEKISH